MRNRNGMNTRILMIKQLKYVQRSIFVSDLYHTLLINVENSEEISLSMFTRKLKNIWFNNDSLLKLCNNNVDVYILYRCLRKFRKMYVHIRSKEKMLKRLYNLC